MGNYNSILSRLIASNFIFSGPLSALGMTDGDDNDDDDDDDDDKVSNAFPIIYYQVPTACQEMV